MNIEQRIEALTVAIIELTETIRDAHGVNYDGTHDEPQKGKAETAKAPSDQYESKDEPDKSKPEPEAQTDNAEQTATPAREELQSECIKRVRESKDDTFKKALQQELKKYNARTINQLPDDAIEPVWFALMGDK